MSGVTSFRIYTYSPRKQRKARLKTIILALVILAVVIELALYGFVLYQGGQYEPAKSDVLLVLGSTIEGTEPGVPLQSRLDKTIELFQQGYGQQIIVSGGQGTDEIVSEAQVMKNYLVSQGIPGEQIILEDRSTSTRENMEFSKRIMQGKGYRSAVVITNDFHIYRGVRTALRNGIQATGATAPTKSWLVHFYRLRETIAILYYWVTG